MKPLTKTIIGLTAAGATYALLRQRKNGRSRLSGRPVDIHGYVEPGYEAVREAFAENFAKRREIGAACCVYHHGEKVVDLWGGVRDIGTGDPWREDTMALVYSATKGLAAMTLAVAHSRGWLDYDERVAAYWPEFARNGKENITVRQLLAHQAGLFALDEPVDKKLIADPDRLAGLLARQRPAWAPGSRQAYHAVTIGFYEGELLRRIDPEHRSLGQFFQDEIATPLGLDFYIRLPGSIPDRRLAPLVDPSALEMLRSFPPGLILQILNPRSTFNRTFAGSDFGRDERRIYSRNLEIPAGGGVGSARALARAYSVFATGGVELGLREETLRALMAPAIPPAQGFYDEIMQGDVRFSLGFMQNSPAFPFGGPGSFGAPGAGGSLGFADPAAEAGYGYIPNRKGVALTGDARDVALREALYAETPVGAAAPVVV